jgi:hypothetical protein
VFTPPPFAVKGNDDTELTLSYLELYGQSTLKQRLPRLPDHLHSSTQPSLSPSPPSCSNLQTLRLLAHLQVKPSQQIHSSRYSNNKFLYFGTFSHPNNNRFLFSLPIPPIHLLFLFTSFVIPFFLKVYQQFSHSEKF